MAGHKDTKTFSRISNHKQRNPYGKSFYEADPVHVASALLGSFLCRVHPEQGLLVGRIVETEAYRGEEDLACHASKGKTPRTEVMYGEPGQAYVYLIYGMYHMLNVVVWPQGDPAAVLIRALEPVAGVEGSTDGPGKLSRAFEIDSTFNGRDLTQPPLFITPGQQPSRSDIVTQARVGIDYAGEWARRPWHFSIRGNGFVSKVRRTVKG